MIAVAELGLTPDIYWQMTPRELYLAAQHRRQTDRINMVTLAWLSANYQRSKKLPELKHELLPIVAPKRLKKSASDTARAQLAAFKEMAKNG